jgi:hypothetical protein
VFRIRKYDPGCSSQIPDIGFFTLPDPEVRKAPDPGSGSRNCMYISLCSADLSIGENLTVHFSAAHEYSSREDGNPRQDSTDVHGGNPALRIYIMY